MYYRKIVTLCCFIAIRSLSTSVVPKSLDSHQIWITIVTMLHYYSPGLIRAGFVPCPRYSNLLFRAPLIRRWLTHFPSPTPFQDDLNCLRCSGLGCSHWSSTWTTPACCPQSLVQTISACPPFSVTFTHGHLTLCHSLSPTSVVNHSLSHGVRTWSWSLV